MKIAYVTMFDATDVRNWSGLDLHIWKSLEQAGASVDLYGKLGHGRALWRKPRKLWALKVERRRFLHLWDIDTSRGFARDVRRQMGTKRYDAIVGPNMIPLAHLETDVPIFIWTDALFSGLLDFYPEFDTATLSRFTASSGLAVERAAIARCSGMFLSSQWAFDHAARRYPEAADRLQMIPFGANLEADSKLGTIDDWIAARGRATLRLLFVGVDWDRKGGPMAVAVADELVTRGNNVELHVVGVSVPQDQRRPFIVEHGFIDKRSDQGKAKIRELFVSSHFFLFPTRAECAAVVVAESAAFALPVVTTTVGGSATLVQDEAGGKLFSLDATPSEWCDWITSCFDDASRYRQTCQVSHKHFRNHLSWKVAGAAALQAMRRRSAAGVIP